MTTDTTLLRQRLEEAENAYHLLMTGESLTGLRDADGRQSQFANMDEGKLSAYISRLERQLGIGSRPKARLVRF